MVQIKKRYDQSKKVGISFSEPTRTKQSFKAECDINNIMKRYEKTGIIEHVAKRPPNYGDFSDVTDYQASVNKVMEAQEGFMRLPSKVRSRFQNDPGQFLEFMNNPINIEEMISLGLATARPGEDGSGDVEKGPVKEPIKAQDTK